LKLGTFIVEFHDLIAFVIEQDRITAGKTHCRPLGH
jgi:hypothetical protein